MRRVNRLAGNAMMNIPRSTPTRAIEIMTDVMPLYLFVQKEATATYLRLHDAIENTICSPFRAQHTKSVERITHRLNLDPSNDSKCYSRKFEKLFTVVKESMQLPIDSKYKQPSEYSFYTDGSKMNGQVGSGLVVVHKGIPIHTNHARLPDYATVFQAELFAIALAAR